MAEKVETAVEWEALKTLTKGGADKQKEAVDKLRTFATDSDDALTLTFGDGLFVRVRRSKKTWIVRKMIAGKLFQETLGDFGSDGINSLAEAKTHLQKAIQKFQNTSDEKKKEKQSLIDSASFWLSFSKVFEPGRVRKVGTKYVEIKSGTLKDYFKWTRYMIAVSNPDKVKYFAKKINEENVERKLNGGGNKIETDYERQKEELIEFCQAVGGSIPKTDSEWFRLFDEVAKQWGIATAHKCLAMFRLFSKDYDEDNGFGTRMIRVNEKKLTHKKIVKTRVGDDGKFKAITNPTEFVEMIEKLKADTSDISKFILATAYLPLRRSEWIGLKWSNVDLKNGLIYIKETKTTVNIVHKLSSPLLALIRSLKDGDSEYVFSGRFGNGVSNGAASVCLRRIGYVNKQTLHGFRASLQTIALNNSEKLEIKNAAVIDITLHHIKQDAYNRANLLEMRGEFLEKWAEFVDGKLELRWG